MTSQLQVLDAVVNSCFKDYLKHLHREGLLRVKYSLTPTGRFEKPSVVFISHMIIMPWQYSPPEVIIQGLKEYCIFSAVGECAEYMLWHDSEGVGNHGSMCEEDKDGYCPNHDGGESDTQW